MFTFGECEYLLDIIEKYKTFCSIDDPDLLDLLVWKIQKHRRVAPTVSELQAFLYK